MPYTKKKKYETAVLVCAAVAAVAVLLVYTIYYRTSYALFSAMLLLLCMVPAFLHFERNAKKTHVIVAVAVMSALAAGGRILFAALPSVKPTTAIVLVTGVLFGSRIGFITGALGALASNFFFGHGPWTLWQMVAWGLCGLVGGLFYNQKETLPRWLLCAVGALMAVLFNLLMNAWHIIGFVAQINWQTILATLAASLYFDAVHVASTVVFLFLFGKSWMRKLLRLQRKLAP